MPGSMTAGYLIFCIETLWVRKKLVPQSRTETARHQPCGLPNTLLQKLLKDKYIKYVTGINVICCAK